MRKLFLAAAFLATGLVFTSCSKCGDPAEGDGCIDPAKARRYASMPNTNELDPVCGCDGKTYANPGEADHAGVVRYVKGECTDDNNFRK